MYRLGHLLDLNVPKCWKLFFVLDTLPESGPLFFFCLPPLFHLVPFGGWIVGFIFSHKRAPQFNQSTRDPDGFRASRKHPELVLSSGRSFASVVILSLLSFVLRVADHSRYYSFDILHGHCHTIAAHSRCHIIIRNTRATIPYYYTCAIVPM